MTTSFLSGALESLVRWGRPLREALFLSLADDRIVPRRHVSVLLESGGVSVTLGSRFLSRETAKGARRYPLGENAFPAPEALASAAALGVSDLEAAGAQATLVIPAAWAIVKSAEFPLTVKENLSNVISYELDRLTPLSPERAFYDFRILSEDADRLRILLAAAKSETIQPYLEALRKKGVAVQRVSVAGEEGMNLLDRGMHRPPKRPLALTFVLLAALAALGLYWLVSPLRIEEWRIAAVDREIASRKAEVGKIESLKKEIEGIEQEIIAIRNFKIARPVMIDLLREMTRILPDNAWLSRIRFTESTVDIEGYAASATAIVPKLEASGFFKKVEFSSPTFRDTRLNADRFLIKMEIDGLPAEKVDHEKIR
jgi:general secretion pathway protein L